MNDVVEPSESLAAAKSRPSQLVIAPGCYDVVSARTAEAAGFDVGYLTPFGLLAAHSYLSFDGDDAWPVVVETATRISRAGNVRMIIDLHTGMEGDKPVERLIRDIEGLNVFAVAIEDRKGFGHKTPLMEIDEFRRLYDRVRNATADGVPIVARTDAVRLSLDAGLERARAFIAMGADYVMPLMTRYLVHPDTPEGYAERKTIYARLADAIPPAQTVVHSPRGRHLSVADARKFGFGVYVMPQLMLAASVAAMTAELRQLESGAAAGPVDALTPTQIARLMKTDGWLNRRW